MRKGHTIYAKSTGVEITAITRTKRKKGYVNKFGAIRLRFFQMGEKKSIKVLLSSPEAHKFSRIIRGVVTKKPNKPIRVLYHEYEKDGQKVQTSVSVEYWKSKDGKKEGYAILLNQRNGGEVKINVPVSKDEFLFLADFLHHLSLEQSWFTTEVVEEGTEEAPPVPPPEEEEVSDPDEVHPEIDEVEVGDDIGDIDF